MTIKYVVCFSISQYVSDCFAAHATPGLYVAHSVSAPFLFLFNDAGIFGDDARFSFPQCLLFSALISAVDPVAVSYFSRTTKKFQDFGKDLRPN